MKITAKQLPRTRAGFNYQANNPARNAPVFHARSNAQKGRFLGGLLDGLGDLGAASPSNYPDIIPAGGVMESYVSGGSYQTRPVPQTITRTDRGGPITVKNPDYVPPGWYRQSYADTLIAAGQYKPTWKAVATKEQWIATRPPLQSNTIWGTSDRGGTPSWTYVNSPQYYLDGMVWLAYGREKGWLPADNWMDKISAGISMAVQAVVIAGISYGLAQGIGQIAAKSTTQAAQVGTGSPATATAPATAAPAPVSASVSPVTATAATPAGGGLVTAGAGSTTTAGALLAKAGTAVTGGLLKAGAGLLTGALTKAVSGALNKEAPEEGAPETLAPGAAPLAAGNALSWDMLKKAAPFLAAGFAVFFLMPDDSKRGRKRKH